MPLLALPQVVPDLPSARALAIGGNFGCVLLADESVRCWGKGVGGELGNGSTEDSFPPVKVLGL